MDIEPLMAEIMEYFPKRRKSVLKNILILSLSILLKETICLYRLKGIVSTLVGNESKPDSNYKRLVRIFNEHALSRLWLDLLVFVFRLLRLRTERLLLDGTSWQRGGKWYHFMTLCLVYKGVAIPFFWVDLSKKGISDQKERKELLRKAMKHFDLKGKTLIADREYMGEEWFKYMIDNGLHFVIRLRHKVYESAVDALGGRTYKQLCNKVKRSKLSDKALGKVFMLNGVALLFVVAKNPKNDPKSPLIFIVTSRTDMSPKKVVVEYGIRYKIEHCFKHLKSNGFNLEQMNLRTKSKNRLLMAVTVFAYVLSINQGLKEYDKVPEKNYGDYKEKTVSVFRKGLDEIMKWCRDLVIFCTYIVQEIIWKIPKYKSPYSINVQ